MQDVYKMRADGMYHGVAPDGTHMELGATIFRGRDLNPIEAIDWDKGIFRHEHGDWQDIPEEQFDNSDIVWDANAMGKSE